MSDITAAELVRRLREGAATGLTLAAHRCQAVAVPLTPVYTGDLRSSLTVVPATPDDLEAAVVSDLPYAVRQHEDLTLHHEGGGAKFLEIAAGDVVGDAQRLIATAANRAMES